MNWANESIYVLSSAFNSIALTYQAVKDFFSHSVTHHIKNHVNSLKGKVKGLNKVHLIEKILHFINGDLAKTI